MLSTNTLQISHIALEFMIDFEKSFRDTLIEQYKIMYPGLKYGDPDILQETLSLTKTLTCDFFTSYKQNTYTKLKSCIDKLKSNYTIYASASSSVKVDQLSFSNQFTPICVHERTEYDPSIPDLDVVNAAICDIKSDYDRFIDGDEELKKFLGNMKSLNETNVKKLCKSQSKRSVDEIDSYIRKKFVGPEKKVTLDYELVKSAVSKKKKFSGNIKTINGIVDKYIHLIDKMIAQLKSHIIETKFTSIDDINLDYADPENLFFRYELTKLSNILNATTQILYSQMGCISGEMDENIHIIQEYIRVK